MTPKNPNPPLNDDDPLFDLLVDGQLDEPRRRELLAGLDDRPGGWRRCALAFLEAQSWREAMDALAGAPSPAEPASNMLATQDTQRRNGRWSKHITTLLGMAASFLLAIGLTSWMHDIQRAGGPVGGTVAAGITGSEFTPHGQTGQPLEAIPLQRAPESGHDVQLVGMLGKGPDGRFQTVGLPAVTRDQLDEDWLQKLPSAIPEKVTQSLQRAGHEVHGSRQLVPFRLKDGRRLVVPVDQLDVHYASNPGYQ
ncbi:MAG: hypothetical protein JW888_04080 [Pirellulales bacterium]|nr:hypothetical protein [Pirellulales bacterium]